MKKTLRNITAALLLALSATGATAADNILSIRDTITDPHIVYPNSYEADTHVMMKNWYMQNYTELARESYGSDTQVEPTDDELIARLMTMPTVIEMPFNSVVKSYIKMYVDRKRSLVESMLGMSTYYMPIFEQALEQEGVPMELKYLPIIESALNPNAVSHAGAAGLWQFMVATARGLGMEVNSLVDERRDPIRSSQMAARYLKQLYDIYNDWSLAIAAYNCGPGNVNKALRRAGNDDSKKKDFWEIYPYLPAETRGYVPGFIAANYAMNYYDKHNISPVLARRPIITDSVLVKKRVYFQQIADVLNIPIEEIRLLNPQYRQDVIPGDIKAYPLVLPSHQALCYIISEDSIVAHEAEKYARRGVVEPATGTSKVSDDGKYIITEEIKFHKVKKGETFTKIAKRYGVTVASIKKANGIKSLKAGRTIKIVTTKKVLKPEEPEEETTTPTDSIATSTFMNGSIATSNADKEMLESNMEISTVNVSNTGAIPTAADNDDDDTDNEFVDMDGGSDSSDSKNVDDADADGGADDAEADAEVADEAVEVAPKAPIDAKTSPDTIRVSDDSAEAAEVRNHVQSTFNSRKPSPEEKAETPKQGNTKVQQADNDTKAKQSTKKKDNTPKPVYHKVKKGETLSKIARRYGTTVKKIQKLNNNINGSKIQIGQRIRVK